MFQYSVFTRFFIKQIGDDKCSKILFSKKQELSFRNKFFIFAAVTIIVYRYDRMTVSIRIGCPLYRYCIDTDCIAPALVCLHSKRLTRISEHHSISLLTQQATDANPWTSQYQFAYTANDCRESLNITVHVSVCLHSKRPTRLPEHHSSSLLTQ